MSMYEASLGTIKGIEPEIPALIIEKSRLVDLIEKTKEYHLYNKTHFIDCWISQKEIKENELWFDLFLENKQNEQDHFFFNSIECFSFLKQLLNSKFLVVTDEGYNNKLIVYSPPKNNIQQIMNKVKSYLSGGI